MTSRRFVFTTFVDDDTILGIDETLSKVRQGSHFRGMCYQLERCPSTSREHIQGYIEYSKPRRFNAVRAELPPGSHLEPARGSRASNIEYCTKSDTRVSDPIVDEILLERGGQGDRSDLRDISRRIIAGDATEGDVADEQPELLVKYPRGIEKLLSVAALRFKSQLRNDIKVSVIYGPAGCGKTRYAFREPATTYILDGSNSDTLWFDGYQHEPTLLIDDFYGWIRHGTLLRILDVYPYRCPIKGSHTYAGWTNVYITSNRHPSTWYDKWKWDEDTALQRRIHHIWQVNQTMFGTIWTCEKTGLTMSFDSDYNKM